MAHYDIDHIKQVASHAWPDILQRVGGLDPSLFDGRHHPCPQCGGDDRFRLFTDSSGGAICNQCFNRGNGDGFATLSWLTGLKFTDVIERVANHLGIEPDKKSKKKKGKGKEDVDPEKDLQFIDWQEFAANLFCINKPGITVEGLKACHAQLAVYYKKYQVFAFPIWGPQLTAAKPIGWVIMDSRGGKLPAKGGESVGKKITWGSGSGLIGPVERINQEEAIWKLEGVTDCLAHASLPDIPGIGVTNTSGAQQRPEQWILDLFKDKKAIVLHDADQPGLQGATYVQGSDGRTRPGWAPCLAEFASRVRHAQLPYEIAEKHGKDLRDYINDSAGQNVTQLVWNLALAGQIIEGSGVDVAAATEIPESYTAGLSLARKNLERYATTKDGATVRWWNGSFFKYDGRRYVSMTHADFQSKLWLSLERIFQDEYLERKENGEEVEEPRNVNRKIVSEVMDATQALRSINSSKYQLNSWIGEVDDGEPRKREMIAFQNGLMDMGAVLDGGDSDLEPHTPMWFSTVCLPYEFRLDASCPRWLSFLDRCLEGDQERIAILQEWFGYNLVSTTKFNRFLLMEGEGKNGKSVACKVLQTMLGTDNCSNVPLEQLSDRFSRWNTVGKLANIAADIGEIDKHNEGLLKAMTSGDPIYADRKNKDGMTIIPTARLTFSCNVRPRFSDKSSGIWRRMLIIPWNVEITAEEQDTNLAEPEWWEQSGELPGIFLWAMQGLKRLREQGDFSQSSLMNHILEDYRDESNPAREFLRENCRISESTDDGIECQTVFERYKKWARNNQHGILSQRSFNKEAMRFFPEIVKVRRGPHRRQHFARMILIDDVQEMQKW